MKRRKNKKNNGVSNHDPHFERESKKYENPIASREYIIQFIESRSKPATFNQLVKELKIANKPQKKALDNRLAAMVRDGQIRESKSKYELVTDKILLEGEVVGHPDGFGFIKLKNQESKSHYSYFVAHYEMRKVLPGDTVQFLPKVTDKPIKSTSKIKDKIEVKIIKVIKHKANNIVGKLSKIEDNKYLLIPEDTSITNRLEVDLSSLDAKIKTKIKDNLLVSAEILSRTNPTVKVTEIIGEYFAPGVEIEAAMRRFEIPHEWPEQVLFEAKEFTNKVSEDDKDGRIDLRDLDLVTIDGEDAKDFDDAVFCDRLPDGNLRLIVAIADVSYYVQPDSSLDKEAFVRGNSVYFPGRVVPMLPEVLSNGLCSLNPEVDRLCFASEVILDNSGKIVKYRFVPAVMRSKARLTYNKVAKILIDKDKDLIAEYSNLLPNLSNLYKLFGLLLQQRDNRGAIDFDSTETMIEFDESKKIKAIHPVVRNDAHRLIEECMLVANVCAAHFCLKNKISVLYRNHAPPPEDKAMKLQEFLRPLGLGLRRLPPQPKDIAKILNHSHHRPDTHVIQMVVLRSLCQAMYQPNNEGHFGLAYKQYAHFTSPIRRYPDLLLHRQLHHYLSQSSKWQNFAVDKYKKLSNKNQYYFNYIKSNIDNIGEHCSSTERRADEATRDVTAWLKCEYMQDKVGESFAGCISGVTNFGIFVELDDVYVEGLVHISDLKDDYYAFDERTHSLIGERARKKYAIGDPLVIVIAKVDLDTRRIDFILPEFMEDVDFTSRTVKSRKKKSKQHSNKGLKSGSKFNKKDGAKNIKKNSKSKRRCR